MSTFFEKAWSDPLVIMAVGESLVRQAVAAGVEKDAGLPDDFTTEADCTGTQPPETTESTGGDSEPEPTPETIVKKELVGGGEENTRDPKGDWPQNENGIDVDSLGLPYDSRINGSGKNCHKTTGVWNLKRQIETSSPGLVEKVRAELVKQKITAQVKAAETVTETPVETTTTTTTTTTTEVETDATKGSAVVAEPAAETPTEDDANAYVNFVQEVAQAQIDKRITIETINANLKAMHDADNLAYFAQNPQDIPMFSRVIGL